MAHVGVKRLPQHPDTRQQERAHPFRRGFDVEVLRHSPGDILDFKAAVGCTSMQLKLDQTQNLLLADAGEYPRQVPLGPAAQKESHVEEFEALSGGLHQAGPQQGQGHEPGGLAAAQVAAKMGTGCI